MSFCLIGLIGGLISGLIGLIGGLIGLIGCLIGLICIRVCLHRETKPNKNRVAEEILKLLFCQYLLF